MRAENDARLVRCLDGLWFSFEIMEHINAELHATCARLPTDKSMLPAAFWKAWSFVDVVHRIRQLAQAVPGLNQKLPELVSFLENTKAAETFRNYIQHLRREITQPPGNNFPAWGNLAWVDANDSQLVYIAVAGARIEKTSYGGCIYDNFEKKWVSKVTLSIGNDALNFDPMAEACIKLREFIIPWILGKYSPGIQLQEELPLITLRIQTGNIDDNA